MRTSLNSARTQRRAGLVAPATAPRWSGAPRNRHGGWLGTAGSPIDRELSLAGPFQGVGQPLNQSSESFFGQRFRHDFSQVRVHADQQTTQAARSIDAQAFTIGNHIGFDRDRFAPRTGAGRGVLAHELAHVARQEARPYRSPNLLIMRKSAEEAPAEPSAVYVTLTVSVATDAYSSMIHQRMADPATGTVDATDPPVYTGDVLTVSPLGEDGALVTKPLTWSLPAGVEEVEETGDARKKVRIVEPMPKTIDLILAGASPAVPIKVRLAIAPLPSRPDALNPALALNERKQSNLHAERRRRREAFRSLSLGERAEQRPLRRAERRRLRQEARALKQEAKELGRSDDCGLELEKAITASLAAGVGAANSALSAIQKHPHDPGVAHALSKYFRIGETDPQRTRVVTTIRDTLTVARNSMLTVSFESFNCPGHCENPKAGASAGSSSRGGPVQLCPIWQSGDGLNFGVAAGVADARAYALLHEFVHLSGPSHPKEAYVHQAEWNSLTPKDTLEMADSYAALAWTLAKGGSP